MDTSLFKARLTSFAVRREGSTALLFALATPVILFGIGVALDYGEAAQIHSSLNAAADAAALGAVSAAAMAKNDDQAKALAKQYFNSNIAGISRLILPADQPVIAITHPNGALGRVVQVTYTAQSQNIFAAVIGVDAMTLKGSATASSSISPNINFTVLLDNSSSMALPATQAGIAKMQALTPQQNNGKGCAFACHEINANYVPQGYAAQVVGNPCVDGSFPCRGQMIDNYQLARANNITLRFDEVGSAMSSLLSTAQTQQNSYATPPAYNFAVYSLNSQYKEGLTSIMASTGAYTSTWQNSASKLQLYTVYGEDSGCVASGSNPCASGALMNTQTGFTDTGYMDTDLTGALRGMASTIPKSGSGAANDAPKQILFVVTDGVEDQVVGTSLAIQPLTAAGQAQCAALKAQGVEIAVLYTTYFPIPGFWVYDQYVAPVQAQIGANLQACASPGLFYSAAPDADLGAALVTLFQAATSGAHLTQ